MLNGNLRSVSFSIAGMAITARSNRRQHISRGNGSFFQNISLKKITSRKLFRSLLICLFFIAIIPPIFFHFKLRRFRQMQQKKCAWLSNPPLVCAHGGDSTTAFPNTMSAYNSALRSQVDCIEIDVSRSSDGVLFALHDRDLQRISGNGSSKVGYLSMKEIKELKAASNDRKGEIIPTVEDALKMISGSVQHIILDAKVGPPFYEKGLAKDILDVIEGMQCNNCIVWAKSDNLVRDIMKLSSNTSVGYIVMKDPSTGARTNLLRMRGATVVGIYHPLIEDKVLKVLHRRKKKVYAWTVDDEASMEKMLFEHVDGVVTSNPSLFQRVMSDTRTQCLEDGFSL